MGEVTVSETVSRSVTVDVNNNIMDKQTAMARCFQFIEERRFDEAHIIIEQILNIDPHNTDIHIANFLYHFRLTCVKEVADKCQYLDEYLNSVFYKRIENCSQTDLSLLLNSWVFVAKSQLDKLQTRKRFTKLKFINILTCIIGLSVLGFLLFFLYMFVVVLWEFLFLSRDKLPDVFEMFTFFCIILPSFVLWGLFKLYKTTNRNLKQIESEISNDTSDK